MFDSHGRAGEKEEKQINSQSKKHYLKCLLHGEHCLNVVAPVLDLFDISDSIIPNVHVLNTVMIMLMFNKSAINSFCT